jgi:L-amino acid N-acyltransferase YncA
VDIRDATAVDMAEIAAIHNELLDTTTFTWTEQHQTAAERLAGFEARQARGFPTLVAVHDARVHGVATYADFRDSSKWPGYRFTVEHSVNVRGDGWRQGIGRRLMLALLDRAKQAGIHAMIGAIDASNQRSIEFHEQLGFREVARMPETGWKHGHWCDLVLLQRFVDAPGSPR